MVTRAFKFRTDRKLAPDDPLLEMAGRREVWTKSHGRASRYHAITEHGMAACRPNPCLHGNKSGIVICEQTIIPMADVPAHMCCLRPGCRERFLSGIQ